MSQAAGRIEKGELKDAREAEIELRMSIGSTQQDLAAFDAAERMLVPAVDLARARYGASHPKTAERSPCWPCCGGSRAGTRRRSRFDGRLWRSGRGASARGSGPGR